MAKSGGIDSSTLAAAFRVLGLTKTPVPQTPPSGDPQALPSRTRDSRNQSTEDFPTAQGRNSIDAETLAAAKAVLAARDSAAQNAKVPVPVSASAASTPTSGAVGA